MRFTLLVLFLASVNVVVLKAQNYVQYHQLGIAALQAENYSSYLDNAQKADSLRPNHPVLMYNLAKSYALNNQQSEAVKTLEILTHFYAAETVLDTVDFNTLLESQGWSLLEEMVKTYQSPIKTSKLAFQIEKAGFHPEGIVYHPGKELFYMTDIREGVIYKATTSGSEVQAVANLKELGFWSAMGVAIDPIDEDILWVTSSSIPIFSGFSEENEGRTAVLKINAQTGRLVKAYIPNNSGHLFGDLLISSSGKPYITDSNTPIVYSIDEAGDSLVQAFKNKDWWNLQGLAFSDDEQVLYVSDYILGIFKIEIQTGAITPLISENERLRGGDGIYQKNNKLIILQNGSNPKRIAQIALDASGDGIASSLYFPDQARTDMEEPTLGTWVNSELYYIGNSPWGYYDEENQPKTNEWPILKIFRLNSEQ